MRDQCERAAHERAQLIVLESQRHLEGSCGIELIRLGMDEPWCGAVILPSAKRVGKWQLTFFDEHGFCGDSQFPSCLDAVEEAVLKGFDTPRPGLLRLALALPAFTLGLPREDLHHLGGDCA